jgi:flagellar export protein FliJ
MRRNETLGTIRTLADRAEQESARALADRRARLENEEQRLAQLRSYMAEYGELSGNASGIFIDTIRTRRAFVDRLRSGIEQQEKLLAGLNAQLENDLQRWRDARSRALGLERFMERRQEEQDLRDNRKEQATLDEIGLQMHLQAGN